VKNGREHPIVESYQGYRHPPPLYRLARALRRASTIALVLLILFAASAVYSAALTAQSGSNLSSLSETFANNGTLVLSGVLTFNNNGFYQVQGLTLSLRVSNASGNLVGTGQLGPATIPGGQSASYPLTLYIPVSASGPGPSLLTEDQPLPISVWANATFGYIFPVGLTVSTTRSWGAPFSNLNVSVGAPTVNGSGTFVPITLTFQNHAPFSDTGTLQFSLLSSGGSRCGGGGFGIDVPSGAPYSQRTSVHLANGCSPAGGTVDASYVTPDFTVSLPPEKIP
jgi:hypothetical protein